MERLSRTLRALALVIAPAAVLACSGADATGPDLSDVEIRAASGTGQFAEPGAALPAPFEVELHTVSSQKAREGVVVEWRVVEGDGATLSRSRSTTDERGTAATMLTLGGSPGVYRVEAAAPGARGSPVEFRARAVDEPVLTAVPAGPVAPGETVVLEGRGFIPQPDEMVVTFSDIRGAVVKASEATLRARVPSCLPPGPVAVVVSLGNLRSEPRSLRVEGEGPTLEISPGETHTVADPRALACVRLPGSREARYLADVHSTSTLGAATFDYGLALRAGDGAAGVPSPVSGGATVPSRTGTAGAAPPSLQARWDRRVRRLERAALVEGRPAARPRPAPVPVRVPEPGDTREFQVLNSEGDFTDVTAEVRHVGEHAVVYVDRGAPDGGFDSADLALMGGEFDEPIHPVVSGIYGRESDLDGNGRIVILFTPVVNRLTEPGSDGFVGGFFFGVDLMEDRTGSNGGEIFYALVPDPDGEFGDPRSRERVMSTVPAILAHEFQHMVHFNQRVLVRGAGSTDALWLSEGLATAAEDLVAREFGARGREERSRDFREGNYIRAVRFLDTPRNVSLVVGVGQGSLEERGAGWLFFRYLEGRSGGTEILGRLTRTTLTGVENVVDRTGIPWPDLISDWSAALYLECIDVPVLPHLTFQGFDLRAALRTVDARFTIEAPVLGGDDGLRVRSIRPSAADFVLLEPTGDHGLAVNLAGPRGGPPAPEGRLRLRLVRLR